MFGAHLGRRALALRGQPTVRLAFVPVRTMLMSTSATDASSSAPVSSGSASISGTSTPALSSSVLPNGASTPTADSTAPDLGVSSLPDGTSSPVARGILPDGTPTLYSDAPSTDIPPPEPLEDSREPPSLQPVSPPPTAPLPFGIRRICPALRSIMDTYPAYDSIFMPSRLLMDALTVHLNSRGGTIDARDRTEAIERGTRDYKTARPTIEQRLLKDGDRLITLGEVRDAVGPTNAFVWKTISSLLKKYGSPGIESVSEEDITAAVFERIPSLGPRTAQNLAKAGLKTLQDLADSPTVKPKVKNYIKLLDVLDRGIPRAEVEEYEKELQAAFKNVLPKFEFKIVGSYRRGASYSESIKVLVWNTMFESHGQISQGEIFQHLWRVLQDYGLFKLDNMILGGPNSPHLHTRLAGLTQLGVNRPLRYLDIRLVATDSMVYRTFWDTGADWVVRHMILEAKKRCGLHLWPGGMYPLPEQHPPETSIMVDTERELFNLLDVPYLSPVERGPNRAETILPKLRAWSSASRPTEDFARRVLAQATVVKPGRVQPVNVPILIAASRLPLPAPRTRDVPAFPRFPRIEIEGANADIEDVQRRAAASLNQSRFRADHIERLHQKRAAQVQEAVDAEGKT